MVNPERHQQAAALEASSLQLSVNPAYAGQSITATATAPAREDGQVPTHTFSWVLNDGVTCPGGEGTHEGATLPSGATCVGQEWQVTAVPRLSERFFGPPTTKSVTIRALPGAPSVTFLPMRPYENQPVIVQASQPPPDEAVAHRCAWTLKTPVEGCASEKTLSGCILPADTTCAHEDWEVVVTPEVEGGLTGTPVTVALNDIQALPEMPTQLFLSPYLDALDVVAEATSPQVDELEASHTYTWTLIEAPCAPVESIVSHDGAILPSRNTCAGQLWRVDARATYPAIPPIPGRPVFEMVTIEAAPPEPVIGFSPATPNTNDPILASVLPAPATWGSQNWLVDLVYRWERSPCVGSCQVSTLDFLLNTDTNTGDVFTLTVTQRFVDARTGTPHARSPVTAEITIANEPPTLEHAGLSLYTPRVDDTIRAYASGYQDLEGMDPTDGSSDPEDFYRKASYQWLIDDVPLSPAICGGPATNGGDVCDLRAAAPPPGSALRVRALPYDGDVTNDADAIELGPYALQPQTIEWRRRTPALRNGAFTVTFDPTHERFLILEDDGNLWEWTKALGFVALSPSGTGPSFNPSKLAAHVRTVYDDEDKHLLWLGVDTGDNLVLYSLDVSERGREVWQQVIATNPPPALCLSAVSIEPQRKHLFLFGGMWPCAWTFEAPPDLKINGWQGTASNQMYVVDYASANPNWTSLGSIFSGTPNRRLFGASAVSLPSMPEQVLLLGGLYTNSNPPFPRGQTTPVTVTTVDLGYVNGSPNPSTSQWAARNKVPGQKLATFAFAYEGKVYGGPGVSSFADYEEPFWVFDPADGGLMTSVDPTDFDAGDLYARFGNSTLTGAALGAAGVMDGELLMYVGESFDPALEPAASYARFRIARRIANSITGEDTWRVAYSTAREQAVPLAAITGGLDGATAMFGGAHIAPSTGHWGGYSTALQRWTKICDAGPVACAADYDVQGLNNTAAAAGGGFYVVGGTDSSGNRQSMRPQHFHNGAWSPLGMVCPASGCPTDRSAAVLFETGCAGHAFGIYGGEAMDTWIHDANRWQNIGVPDAFFGISEVAYDGRRYAIQLVQGFSFNHVAAGVLDACAATPAWDPEVTFDAPDGLPIVREFFRSGLLRVWDDPPTFVYPSNGPVWFLRETDDKVYTWEMREDTVEPRTALGPLLWDEARRRVLNYGGDEFSLWELLLPASIFE